MEQDQNYNLDGKRYPSGECGRRSAESFTDDQAERCYLGRPRGIKASQLPPKPIIGVDLPKLVAVDLTVYNGAAIKQLPMVGAMDGPKND